MTYRQRLVNAVPDAAAQYEQIRSSARALGTLAGHEEVIPGIAGNAGIAVFLRRGMAAWMEVLAPAPSHYPCTGVRSLPSSAGSRSAQPNLRSEIIFSEMVPVLAAMILGQPKEAQR